MFSRQEETESAVEKPRFGDGGGKGIRTPDLLIANETLYQLSYTPTSLRPVDFVETWGAFVKHSASLRIHSGAGQNPAGRRVWNDGRMAVTGRER